MYMSRLRDIFFREVCVVSMGIVFIKRVFLIYVICGRRFDVVIGICKNLEILFNKLCDFYKLQEVNTLHKFSFKNCKKQVNVRLYIILSYLDVNIFNYKIIMYKTCCVMK